MLTIIFLFRLPSDNVELIFQPNVFQYSYLLYILTRIFKLSVPPGQLLFFFGDGWLAGAPLIDQMSRFIAVSDIILHRRLIAIKKQKRPLKRINRIAPFVAPFTTLLTTRTNNKNDARRVRRQRHTRYRVARKSEEP